MALMWRTSFIEPRPPLARSRHRRRGRALPKCYGGEGAPPPADPCMGSGARGEAGRRPGAQAVVACRGPLDGEAARGGGAEQAARRHCAGAVHGAHAAVEARGRGG